MSYYDRDRNPRTPGTDARTSAFTAAQTMNHPITHHGNVAEYQASGFPFVYTTNGAVDDIKIQFPFVTQWICVSAIGGDVSIAFKPEASNDSTDDAMKFTIKTTDENSPPVFRFRCTDLYVTSAGNCSIAAGLTSVSRDQFPDITELEGVHTVTIDGTTTSPSPPTP